MQVVERLFGREARRIADVRLQERDELLSRPVLNVYDLASPATCNVFVNRKAGVKTSSFVRKLARPAGLVLSTE